MLMATTNQGVITWYTDQTLATVLGTGSPFNAGPQTNATGVYWVNAVNQVCASAPAAMGYILQATPPAVTILGEGTPTELLTELYSVPQALSSTYTWTITGGSILFGQGTNIVNVQWGAAGPGMLTVVETTSAGCPGETSEINVTILPENGDTYIGENQAKPLLVQPNPFHGQTRIQLPDGYAGNYNLQLVDYTGRTVKMQSGSGSPIIELNASGVASGVYLVRVQANETYVQRVVIQ